LLDVERKMESQNKPGSDVGPNVTIQSRVARLLIQKLSEDCERYCILTGYEELPDRFDTDIDFMVEPRDFPRIPALVDAIADETGTRLFQAIAHEISACAFRLASSGSSGIAFIQPDSCSDYRHFGKLWLNADTMLKRRRWHPRGFWIPAAADEFIYYLIKRINKRDFTAAHGARLSQLYREAPPACDEFLRRFWGARSAAALGKMAAVGEWAMLMRDLELFRRELRKHSGESFGSRALSFLKSGLHTLERVLHPTGGWIAFVGPDGCGKSSVIDAVVAEFAPAFQKIVRFHLRPKSLPARSNSQVPVTDPHGQPVRGGAFSVAKMLYLFGDYWLGYISGVRRNTVRTRLVVFDRYFYDIIVDPKRVLYGGPRWLPPLLSRLVPRPDLVILLNASPQILWSRKQEVRYEEVVRQQKDYVKLAGRIGRAVVIDAGRPLPEVVVQVREAILNHFSARTRKRLSLTRRARSLSNRVSTQA
jgi:thymidylate kinase